MRKYLIILALWGCAQPADVTPGSHETDAGQEPDGEVRTCLSGSLEEGTCGLNNRGTALRACENGVWGEWSLCSDPDDCVDGETESQTCAPGGRERLCVSGQWAAWSACKVRYTGVAVGERALCGLEEGGRVVCSGLATPAPTGVFADVAMGPSYACGIRSDGFVSCWGEGSTTLAPSGAFQRLGAGRDHACGVHNDGTIACWGATYGTVPSRRFVRVAAGDDFTCGITDGSAVRCWGKPAWVDATGSGAFKEIAAGSDHACGLTGAGAVQCWGDNATGEASPPALVGAVAITAGPGYTCALRGDLSAVCWGQNREDLLRVPATRFDDVTGGPGLVCGVRPGGTIECWGRHSPVALADLAGRSDCGSYGPAPTCGSGSTAVCVADQDTGVAITCDDGNNRPEAATPMGTVTDSSDGATQLVGAISDADEDWYALRVEDTTLGLWEPRIELASAASVALCAYYKPDTAAVHGASCAASSDGSVFPSRARIGDGFVEGCCVEGRPGGARVVPLLVNGAPTASFTGIAYLRAASRQGTGAYTLKVRF